MIELAGFYPLSDPKKKQDPEDKKCSNNSQQHNDAYENPSKFFSAGPDKESA
ncbi:hypothetical protein [Metabacillus indicus]|uniref:hypothetical protein n=1 Tax=Metabacillus indicus TaxID=246786 RepID=UPI001378F241|nr:hypothetical protein [Metabacillus indicus]